MKHCILTLLASLLLANPANAGEWIQAARDVTVMVDEAQASAAETRRIIKEQKQAMAKEMNELKAAVAERQKAFDVVRTRYDELLAREKALREELEAHAHELKTIDGTIRTSAKQARDYFHESLTTPEYPQRAGMLDEILDPDKFPGLAGIQNLLTLYLQEMEVSGSVSIRQGSFTTAQGMRTEGEVLRVGTFTAAYRTPDGDMGFLRPGDDGQRLIAVQGDPGWGLSGLMDDYFDRKSVAFPVDISNGAALRRLAQEQRGTFEWLAAGGPLVWPIILVGAVALALVVERFYSLGRIRANSDRDMKSILAMVSRHAWNDCRDFCEKRPRFPACRIIRHTLEYVGSTREIIENAFQEALLKEAPALERFLPTLSVLAAVAPLLGLLGTVTGMINTFQVITLYGTGDPRMMSGGISEALITTQVGLAVAVPIIILHHVLDRRVDRILGDMEEKGASFSVALMKNGLIGAKGDPDASA